MLIHQNSLGLLNSLSSFEPFFKVLSLLLQKKSAFEPGPRHFDGGVKVAGLKGLNQVAKNIGRIGTVDQLGIAVGGKEQNGGDALVVNDFGRIDAIHVWHLYVEDADFGLSASSQVQRLTSVLSFGCDLVAHAFQHLAQIKPDDGIVVGNQNSHRSCVSRAALPFETFSLPAGYTEGMTRSLDMLLGSAIDYAGLFPPAQLSLPDAVREFISELESPSSFLVNGFVLPSRLAEDLEKEGEAQGLFDDGDALAVTLILKPEEGVSLADEAKALAESWDADSWLEPVAVEAFVGTQPSEADLKAMKLLGQKLDVPVFLEFGWNKDYKAAGEKAVTLWQGFGYKARLGGATKADTPTVQQVADFLVEAAGMDVPLRLTAGLHHPLAHNDPIFGGWRHGFLNCLAAALAVYANDAPIKEVEKILEMQSSSAFRFTENAFHAGDRSFGPEDLELFGDYCYGFGSCSISEPYDGLVRLGLIEPPTND